MIDANGQGLNSPSRENRPSHSTRACSQVHKLIRDFQIFAAVCSQLEGGVVLNIGSAVIMPEVFLKALTIARNLGHKVERFTTATFDMTRHYRPTENVQRRPTKLGGQGFYLVGHHEIMIPLLFAAITEELEK